jgi:hypothetical protein
MLARLLPNVRRHTSFLSWSVLVVRQYVCVHCCSRIHVSLVCIFYGEEGTLNPSSDVLHNKKCPLPLKLYRRASQQKTGRPTRHTFKLVKNDLLGFRNIHDMARDYRIWRGRDDGRKRFFLQRVRAAKKRGEFILGRSLSA